MAERAAARTDSALAESSWTITGREHTAIAALRPQDWTAAVDTDGEPRPLAEAAVAEITGLLPPTALVAYPAGARVVVRRERPHPGAQPT